MIVDCIADLHGHYPKLEGGDLLIVGGDLTARGTQYEVDEFDEWLAHQEYKKKIFIGGNHDNCLVGEKPKGYRVIHGTQVFERFEYLIDSGTEFEGLNIWGSPWTLKFEGMNPRFMAFTCDTEEELAEKWALIPDETDILVTHGPAFGAFDKVERWDPVYHNCNMENVGSTSLLRWTADHVDTLKLHVHGHIHEGYGIWDLRKAQIEINKKSAPVLTNCSHVNERYEPVNKPIRVVL